MSEEIIRQQLQVVPNDISEIDHEVLMQISTDLVDGENNLTIICNIQDLGWSITPEVLDSIRKQYHTVDLEITEEETEPWWESVTDKVTSCIIWVTLLICGTYALTHWR